MRAYIFEGTPEEVKEAMKQFGATSVEGVPASAKSTIAETVNDEQDEDESGDVEHMDEGVARRALSRLPLQEKPKAVLKAMFEADEENGILASELQKLIGYTKAQFAGLMGAFGRRLSSTRGFIDGTTFFICEWDDDEGCYRYRLTPESRAAVKREVMK